MRKTNGQFAKNNKAAVKTGSKKHKSYAGKVVFKDVTEQKETRQNTRDYLPFGDDNLFPLEVAELYRKSPVARAIVDSKLDYILGEGFDTESEQFKNYNPNPTETKWAFTKKLENDWLKGGNMFIHVVKLNGIVNLFHVDWTKCRYTKDRDAVIIHPDWKRFESNRKLGVTLPLFPNFTNIAGKQGQHSIIHVKDYEATFDTYGIPNNIASLDSAKINYKTNRWNVSRLENGFAPSGVLSLNADFDDDEANQFQEDFNGAFTGEGGQGQALFVVNAIGQDSTETKWTSFAEDMNGSWMELHDQATKELIVANRWFPALAGINVSSGFDTERIKNEYQVAKNTTIAAEQSVIIEMWQKISREVLGFTLEDLEIINQPPISLVEVANVHSAIIQVKEAIAGGFMNEEAARETIKISFELSEEQLDKLFR